MEVGERAGYRARGIDPLVEVEVLRIGSQKPARVLVRFRAEQFEGREEWVPPSRLKVAWADAAAFEEREARWDAVDTHPGLRDAPEEYAIDAVFNALIDEALASVTYRWPGVTTITDAPGLARYLQIDEATLRAEPSAFEEDGALIVPWATTELIVRRACELYPDAVLREVDKDEAKAREQAMHGRVIQSSRRDRIWHVDPKEAAEWDAERPYGRSMRDLLRRWCGTAAVERQDELNALRDEVLRIDGLLAEAIRALQAAGQQGIADDLARRFGVPLDEARESRR